MATIKFIEFNPWGAGVYSRHLAFLAKEQGWDIQFEVYPEFHKDLLVGADIAKVEMSLSSVILPQMGVQPAMVRSLQSVDFLLKEEGTWLPRSFLYEAFKKVLIEQARGLDNRDPAFVVGSSEEAVVVAAGLVNLGFRQIYMTGVDAAELDLKAELLRKNFFGVKFFTLMADYLTAQTIGAGLVINTTTVLDDKELLRDMSYFNFMKRNGFVIDLNLVPQNPLLEEAERAELRAIYPIPFAAQQTYFYLDHLGLLGELTVEDLSSSWEKFLFENFEATSGMI
jgi:shikimate dehydrogenase